jgi:ATP-dependent DNA helicase RecG
LTVTRVDSSAGSTQLSFDLDSITPPRPDLRELWTPDDILAVAIKEGADSLLRFREDNRVEWKSARYSPKELADYFSMWANTQPHGGLIVIGAENDSTVSGCLGVGPDRISEFEQVGPAQCADARFDIRRIEAKRHDGSPDFLLLIRVYYRPDKLVETVRTEAFVRSGKTKRQLSEDEKREIRINKGQIEYEKEPVSLQYPQDFDELLIRDFCEQYRAKRGLTTGHTREQILCLNHLGAMRDGKFGPNLAGALLFGADPRQVVPGARIRFMKFEGIEEKTGQEYNCVKDAFIDGPIPRMITEAEDIVSGQIRNFTRLGKDSKFYTRPEYPADAWLEAVVNACVHRSYNLRNMNIFVKMFDDRLVVESPGGFPPPVTPENIYDTHNPRNPHLMNALFYLDYVKCAHEGTRRMRDMMIGANLPEPEFTQQEISTHQVHVTLRNNIEARKEFVEAGALKLIGESVYEQLSQEEKQVINFLAEKSRINVSDANRLLQKDWQTAKRTLDDLEKRGILMRRSRTGKPRDPSAHYVLRRRSS